MDNSAVELIEILACAMQQVDEGMAQIVIKWQTHGSGNFDIVVRRPIEEIAESICHNATGKEWKTLPEDTKKQWLKAAINHITPKLEYFVENINQGENYNG